VFKFIIHFCIEDEAKEDVNECGDHIDDVVVCFEFDCVQYFCRGTFVVVLAILEFGYLFKVGGEWIVSGKICLTGGDREGSTTVYNRFIFSEMVDLCIWAHLQMYWSELFKMKRVGAPIFGSVGVGNPFHMAALDILALVCEDILLL
jgi:hypothetical protein